MKTEEGPSARVLIARRLAQAGAPLLWIGPVPQCAAIQVDLEKSQEAANDPPPGPQQA